MLVLCLCDEPTLHAAAARPGSRVTGTFRFRHNTPWATALLQCCIRTNLMPRKYPIQVPISLGLALLQASEAHAVSRIDRRDER